MAFQGFLSLGGTEIANAARTKAYADELVPMLGLSDCWDCGDLREALGQEPYTTPMIDQPDWFTDHDRDSWDFAGFYPLEIEGLDDGVREATVTELSLDGAVVGAPRYASREIRVTGLLIGVTDAAVTYGLTWLAKALEGAPCRDDASGCTGDHLCYYAACPPMCTDSPALDEWVDGGAGPFYLCDTGMIETAERACSVEYERTLYRVTTTSGPSVVERYNSKCGSMLRVEFTLVAGVPFAFSTAISAIPGAAPIPVPQVVPDVVCEAGTDVVVRTNLATNPIPVGNAAVAGGGWQADGDGFEVAPDTEVTRLDGDASVSVTRTEVTDSPNLATNPDPAETLDGWAWRQGQSAPAAGRENLVENPFARTTDGWVYSAGGVETPMELVDDSPLRTNLSPNPRGNLNPLQGWAGGGVSEWSKGYVDVDGAIAGEVQRTNWCTDPRATVYGNGWSYQRGTGEASTIGPVAAAVDGPVTGTGEQIGSYLRATITTEKTGGNSGPFYRSAVGAIDVPVDTDVSMSMWVRSSVDTSLSFSVQLRHGTVVGASVNAPATVLVAGEWTRLSYVLTNGSLDAADGFQVWARQAANEVLPAGATLDTTAVLVEITGTVGDYFDGDTDDSPGFLYEWTGDPNESTSTAATRITAPPGEPDTGFQYATATADATGNIYAIHQQGDWWITDITPGQAYGARMSIYAPVDHPASLIVQLRGSWRDADGAVLDGVNDFMIQQRVNPDPGWEVYAGVTPVAPEGAAFLSVFPWWLGWAAATTVTNLMPNPSAEVDLSYYGSSPSVTTMTRDTTWAAQGDASIKVTPTGSASTDTFAGITNAVYSTLTPGSTYTVSATCHLAAPLTGTLSGASRRIRAYWTGGNVMSDPAPNEAGDHPLSLTFTVPADSTMSAIRLYNGAAQRPPRTNLVPNPNIEHGVTGWAVTDGPTVSQNTAVSHSGAASLQVVAARDLSRGNRPGVYSDRTVSGPIAVGTTAHASVWVRAEVGVEYVVGLKRGATPTAYDGAIENQFGTGEWVRHEITYTATTARDYYAVGVFFYGDMPVGSTIWVDEALLELNTSGDYFDGDTVDANGIEYAWSGTVGNSVSTATGVAENPVWWDMVTIVEGSEAVQFDGDTPDTDTTTYAWTGTEGLSTSTAVTPHPQILAGQTIAWAGRIVEATGTPPPDYFDGELPDTERLTYAWTGDTWTSPSTMSLSGQTTQGPDLLPGYLQHALTDQDWTVTYTGTEVLEAGTTYTASVYVRASTGQEVEFAGRTFTLTGFDWTRLSGQITGTGGPLALVVSGSGQAASGEVDVARALVEVGTALRPYFDGGIADEPSWDYEWTGEADASTSTATPIPVETTTTLETGDGPGDQTTFQRTTIVVPKYGGEDGAVYTLEVGGGEYTVDLQVRASVNVDAALRVSALDENGQVLRANNGQLISLRADEWAALGPVHILAPPGTTRLQVAALMPGGQILPAGETFDAAAVRIVSGLYLTDPVIGRVTYLGQHDDTNTTIAVTGGGQYTASVYAGANVGALAQLSMQFFTASGGVAGIVRGIELELEASIEPIGVTEWERPSVTTTAPANAAYVVVSILIHKIGSGAQLGDGAWVTSLLVEQSPSLLSYFDGSTDSASADMSYEWTGTANASTSQALLSIPEVPGPIVDPDCPVVPDPPRPPLIDVSCVDDPTTWRRYVVEVADDLVPEWRDVVPIVRLQTGASAVRQVRIRFYPNPLAAPLAALNPCDYCGEFVVTYIPARSLMTIDGIRQWATVTNDRTGDVVTANHLLASTDGGPVEWPLLGCGVGYTLVVDVSPTGVADLTPQICLAARS